VNPTRRTLSAGWVLPGGDAAPLRRGEVVIEGDRVVDVRPRASAAATDLGPGVLLPGLVNAHCHLELSHLAARVRSAGDFVAWVEELVGARVSGAEPEERAAATAAIESLIACGTVALGDVSNALRHLDLLGAAPLRSVVFFELIGWDPAAASRVMASAEARLREVGGRRPFANVELRLAAHAPHSVSEALFRALVDAGEPASLHLAESPHESRFLTEGDAAWSAFLTARGLSHVTFRPPALSPVRYMDRLGVLSRPGPPLLAVHCVQADLDDCRLLAERGVRVALCPRSNARLGVGTPPLPALLEAGVRLSLGSDSLASAPSLDVMEDARALHRAFPEVAPRVLVEMATAGGADALSLHDLGNLAPGRRAALAYAEARSEPDDPYAFLLEKDTQLRPVAA
jgi:cytosine/adenosine deaminase-related metal-dependent hydrolase